MPDVTAWVMWADISAAGRFRRSWHLRLRRLGLPAMARSHVLGDSASWIWKAAGRALTGCRQSLDIYHSSEHIAGAVKRLLGEWTAEAKALHQHGRGLLLKEGWTGICRLIGEELEREDTPRRRRASDRPLSYFLAHLKRLDYAGRLASGDPIGNGSMEGAAKTLGLRLKARGDRWRQKNAGDGGVDLLSPHRPMGPVLEADGLNPTIPWLHPSSDPFQSPLDSSLITV